MKNDELGIQGRQVYEGQVIDGENNQMDTKKASGIPGFRATTNFNPKYAKDIVKKKNTRKISKFFSDLSRFGMNYETSVVDNMRAIPADKNIIPDEVKLSLGSMLTDSNWKQKSNADKNFYEKDFAIKREVLRKLALQPELEDILDMMTNESIVYDTNYTYFAEPFIDVNIVKDYKKETADKINESINKTFSRIYATLNWKTNAWDDFKRFLIEGTLAWEIVYDSLEKPTKIIGVVPIDAATITKKYDNGKWYWIQFKGVVGKERVLLDSSIIYIQYQETNILSRLSYLERLIRPFNIYRIVEQAQLIWTVTNSSYKTKFTIPISGMNKITGLQTLSTAMNKHKEDIKFIGDTGELTINGQPNLPFNKEYWMPENEAGTPQIEVLGGEGPEMNDNDQLKYFKNILYKMSKIPLNRFDQESGESWFGTDATSVARTEIDFGRFVTRLRNTFAQIILKPLKIQLALDVPDTKDNIEILNAISLQYKSYNLFEEMMEMELMQKRTEFIQTMKEALIDMDPDGNEVKFFSSKFLVKKYLKFSDEELKVNEEFKKQESEEMHLAGDPDNKPAGGA